MSIKEKEPKTKQTWEVKDRNYYLRGCLLYTSDAADE